MSILGFSGKHSTKSEITKLDIVANIKENIAWLEISVQDLAIWSIMTLLKCEYNLHEYLPNDIFSHKIFLCFTLFNQLRHVTILTVFHDDINTLLLFQDDFIIILDNIWVRQFTECVDFVDDLLFFLLLHATIVQFFPDEYLPICLAFDL
eukprot:CAMPEP_0116873902 /NCGR_PEP_ID=MMETSP0463-20121206/5237_1 /TAXON_ID=181622 /ORGANISM="Strombidinopsis sp, Strain SopsisLIS2011" /LENGTH=149 /DNA_ID=CAMNT_0004516757 /DNA_START=2030 /DNA_END=2475 /DNA_ORIENTATION=-